MSIFVYRYFSICSYLSELTDEMIIDSYNNYGDIDESVYKNIITQREYATLAYLREIDYSIDDQYDEYDKKRYVPYDELDIEESYHTRPKTRLTGISSAITTYSYCYKYSVLGDDSGLASHSNCRVEWELQDSGEWIVLDVIAPP